MSTEFSHVTNPKIKNKAPIIIIGFNVAFGFIACMEAVGGDVVLMLIKMFCMLAI